MERYIDADALLKPDNIIVVQDETGIDEFPYTYTYAVKVNTILDAPTANVAPIDETIRRFADRLKRYYDANEHYLGYSIAYNIDRVAEEILKEDKG